MRDLLRECPKHDNVTIEYDNNGKIVRRRVNEIQLRWIQKCIARKEIDYSKLRGISKRQPFYFKKNGQIEGSLKGNTLSLADKLAMDLLRAKADKCKQTNNK